ncbi:leucine-rich repeat transmembrane protein kinase protein [Tanacetum coccineum]
MRHNVNASSMRLIVHILDMVFSLLILFLWGITVGCGWLTEIRKFIVAQDIGSRVVVHIFSRINFAIARGVRADLSYNNLTGAVPKFLASLNFLETLNLIGNNFTRPLPPELVAKSEKGSLRLIIEGISDQDKVVCPMSSCEKKKHSKVVIPVTASIAAFFVLLITLAILWIIKRRRTKAIPDEIIESRNQRFTFREIQSITGNFNTIVGKGGFGTVFHGCIGDNQVAVKMLSESSAQGCREFRAEVHLLMSIHHRYITSLVGYLVEGSQKGIIYQYMENGNLGMHLFAKNTSLDGRPNVMSWKQRLEIGYDAAQAIVHRDVKCSNILLNETFRAKVADFGLSRAFISEGDTHVSTAVAGTPGYLDPELTEKSDVYSFGVVLLELITGRQLYHKISWKVVELAMSCVHSKSIKRPTMNDVVTDLNSCLTLEYGFHGARANDLNEHMSLNLESMRDPNLR